MHRRTSSSAPGSANLFRLSLKFKCNEKIDVDPNQNMIAEIIKLKLNNFNNMGKGKLMRFWTRKVLIFLLVFTLHLGRKPKILDTD